MWPSTLVITHFFRSWPVDSFTHRQGQCSISSSNASLKLGTAGVSEIHPLKQDDFNPSQRHKDVERRRPMAAIIKHYAVLGAKEILQKHPNVPILNIVRVCSPVKMFVYFVTNKEAFIALVGQICMEACFSHKFFFF